MAALHFVDIWWRDTRLFFSARSHAKSSLLQHIYSISSMNSMLARTHEASDLLHKFMPWTWNIHLKKISWKLSFRNISNSSVFTLEILLLYNGWRSGQTPTAASSIAPWKQQGQKQFRGFDRKDVHILTEPQKFWEPTCWQNVTHWPWHWQAS